MSPLLLLIIVIGIIVVTQLLKSIGFVEESIWYIPTACIIGFVGFIAYEVLANSPITIVATLNAVILALVLGTSAAGLYSLSQRVIAAIKGD